jgi:DNA invertase Pin-like site-specific DNA recombinase
MKGQTVGYIRVSTIDQSTERQLDGVALDKTFTDKASGKDTNRPQLIEAMGWVRGGDTLVVHSIDRLARNVEDLHRIVRLLNEKGVSVKFLKENLVFDGEGNSPINALMFTMLSGFAQFERALIRERQREGIALAKKAGKYPGKAKKLNPEQVENLRSLAGQGFPKTQLGKQFGITRKTVYEYLRQTGV